MVTNTLPAAPSAPALDLRRVLVIRNAALAGLSLAMVVVGYNLGMPLPYITIIGIFIALNLLTWARVKFARPVSESEVFVFFLIDITVLSGLLYFAGGATNPFVLLLLLPMIIAAATLRDEFTWSLVAIVVVAYTVLMFFHMPLPSFYLAYSREFDLETWGMWFGFVLTAELIAYLVTKITSTLREREHKLAEVRENTLRTERLVALGALAVGAAHELGTPLGTMAILLNDLERDYAAAPELSEKLSILRAQVQRCKVTLSDILSSTGQSRAEDGYGIALDNYLEEILVEWQAMRPAVSVQHRWQGSGPAPHIVAEKTLGQAFITILNNAADASENGVELVGNWNSDEVCIEVYDRGPGLPPEVAAQAGKLFFTTKESGHGVGLYLAQTIFGRFGGSLRLMNRDGGGACTRVTLPLPRLLATI